MSSPPLATVATRSRTRSSASQSARQRTTRTHDDMERDTEANIPQTSSPRPLKVPRTSIDSDASAATSSLPSSAADSTPGHQNDNQQTSPQVDPMAQALLDELECGMCAGVFIEPLALNGCGHVFCGSCVQQWIKSIPPNPPVLVPGDKVPEPIACPQCRHAPIEIATPSRVAKTMVNFLLERYPAAARPPQEIKQAEEMYTAARGVLKFPTPPPPPRMNQSDYWSPCRWCYSEGQGAWRCPVPVPRFNVPAERPNCIRNDGLCPEGHRLCAGCDRLAPIDSPSSATCGICGEGFCGEAATACDCPAVSKVKPSSQYNSLSYLLEDCSTDMLALAFRDNWTEMCALGGYLAGSGAPKTEDIFRDILAWLRTPEAINTGGLLGLMTRAEINLRLRVGAADDMQSAVMSVNCDTEQRMCTGCADDILCAGILEWWAREIQKPQVVSKLPPHMLGRESCKFGYKCKRQDFHRHSRKYNHICQPMPADVAAKLVQDDSEPAPSTRAPNPPAQSSSVMSDDGDDADDDGNDSEGDASQEIKDPLASIPNPAVNATHVHAATQYDSNPLGTQLVGRSSNIQPCWNILPPARTSQLPILSFSPLTTFGTTNNVGPVQPIGLSSHLSSPPALRLPSPQHVATGHARVSHSASSPLATHASWSPNRAAVSPAHAFSHATTNGSDPSAVQSSSHPLPKYTLPLMSKSSPLHPSYSMSFPTMDPWVPGSMNNEST